MRKDQIMNSIRYYILKKKNYNAAAKTNKQKKKPNLLSTWRSQFAPQSATHTQILQNKSDLIK